MICDKIILLTLKPS